MKLMMMMMNINNKIPLMTIMILLSFLVEKNCFAHEPHTTFMDTPSVENEQPAPHQHIAHPPEQADDHQHQPADHQNQLHEHQPAGDHQHEHQPADHNNDNHHSFPPSGAPPDHIQQSSSNEDDGGGHSPPSSSFSSAFADMLKGAIQGPTLTMPTHPTEGRRSSLGLEQICTHTDYPDVCLATVSPLLVTTNFDLMNVLEAAMKACSLQIKITITKVTRHASTSPEIANAVSECQNQYKNALDNLQRAINALPSHDIGTVTVMLSAVMADVSTCESAFEDLKAPSSPTSKADGLVTITVSNCLSIANLLPVN